MVRLRLRKRPTQKKRGRRKIGLCWTLLRAIRQLYRVRVYVGEDRVGRKFFGQRMKPNPERFERRL